MPLGRHGRAIGRSLKHTCHHVRLRPIWAHSYSSTNSDPEIAVVGGGITGLATAYYLAQSKVKVTLYEASDRLGGWIRSSHVDVAGGRVLFEHGPRTLRPNLPNGLLTANMMQDLGLDKDMLFTSRRDPSALSRFVYYPDHLVELPGSHFGVLHTISTLLFEPLFKGYFRAIFREAKLDGRPKDSPDESIGHFLSRRFGGDEANRLASAVFHGIYAGDIWELSTESLLPAAWFAELESKSLFQGYEWITSGKRVEDLELVSQLRKELRFNQQQARTLNRSSSFTLRNGLQQLIDALGQRLRSLPNVKIMMGTELTSLKPVETVASGQRPGCMVTLANNRGRSPNPAARQDSRLAERKTYHQVISTLPHSDDTLSTYALSDQPVPFVTVGVVSLYFPPNPPAGFPILRGFGYLIPQAAPFDQNPELALGVVYDSCAVKGQDTVPGAKLTVMLGGHYWNGWSSIPTEDECVDMALRVLKRHLGITAKPTAINVRVQKRCIPQYLVGHRPRMAKFHEKLIQRFDGRVKVAGSSYTGVGVNDCIRAAREIAKSATSAGWQERTGLEGFTKEQEWTLEKVRISQED